MEKMQNKTAASFTKVVSVVSDVTSANGDSTFLLVRSAVSILHMLRPLCSVFLIFLFTVSLGGLGLFGLLSDWHATWNGGCTTFHHTEHPNNRYIKNRERLSCVQLFACWYLVIYTHWFCVAVLENLFEVDVAEFWLWSNLGLYAYNIL